MIVRRMIALGCACALAIAAISSREGVFPVAGDTNGDQRVDVLDLQAMVSDLVKGAGAGSDAGEQGVCILDFQRALSLAGQPAEPVSESPPESICKASFFSHQVPQLVVPLALRQADPVTLAAVPSRGVHEPVRAKIPVCTERFLFRLHPNAPPVSA